MEGLVAIALLAGTMFAIFTLVGGVLNSANRVGLSNETAQVTLNTLEVMSVVNPMLQDTGKIDLGLYTVSWKSAATTPVADGVGYPVGVSLYQLALYKTSQKYLRFSDYRSGSAYRSGSRGWWRPGRCPDPCK